MGGTSSSVARRGKARSDGSAPAPVADWATLSPNVTAQRARRDCRHRYHAPARHGGAGRCPRDGRAGSVRRRRGLCRPRRHRAAAGSTWSAGARAVPRSSSKPATAVSARVWSEDLRRLGAPRTMVFAGVAAFTRVCAYDRPGTIAPLNGDVRPSRSDPVPSRGPPRTSFPTSTHCSTPPASLAPTSWPATRWAASSSGSTPAPTPARLSGSSSLTPIPRGSRRC